MRLNLHDFSGHPFQVQLSRELAARGHTVVHSYSTQFVTPHGRLEVEPDDPAGLRIEGVTCERPMIKYSPLGRMRFELDYATAWRAALERERFDLVVACNVPLFTLTRMQAFFARRRQPWVLWHQDLYSLGVAAEAERALPRPVARLARTVAEGLERAQLAGAAGVVPITDDMVTQYRAWGVRQDNVHVIPNWASLDDIRPGTRDNRWARELGLPEGPLRLLYGGTLGRKHNPMLLVEMLDEARRRGLDVCLTVASEGEGAEQLSAVARERDDLRVVGYQPADRLGEMISSADAVVALLEPDAAAFSVPSKVLTYLSAGRPIVALMPAGNPAARDVRAAGGFVGAPSDVGARAAVDWLAGVHAEPGRLAAIGRRTRELAETRFDMAAVGDAFETVLHRAAGLARPVRPVREPALAHRRGAA